MESENTEQRFKELLREATWYRFFSLCFQTPRQGLSEEIKAICKELGKDKNFFESLIDNEDIEEIHHSIIGAGGICSSCESAYVGDKIGGKAFILADVAGFYRAFLFDPQIEMNDPVDNISVELSFLSFLTLKQAYAIFSKKNDEAGVCADAKEKFQREHLLQWIYLFEKKLGENASGSFYEKVTRMLEDFFKDVSS